MDQSRVRQHQHDKGQRAGDVISLLIDRQPGPGSRIYREKQDQQTGALPEAANRHGCRTASGWVGWWGFHRVRLLWLGLKVHRASRVDCAVRSSDRSEFLIHVTRPPGLPLNDVNTLKEFGMKPNVGTIDRILRIALSSGPIAASLMGVIGAVRRGNPPLLPGLLAAEPEHLQHRRRYRHCRE